MQVLVVGGGAAGMMAAIAAAGSGASTTLVEKTGRLGLKIQISGGGRCNITNSEDDPRELARMCPGNGRFLMDAFRAFRPGDIRRMLARHGVPTKAEAPYGKIFPQSDSARDVLAALRAELAERGVAVRLCTPIASLATAGDRVVGAVTPSGETIAAAAVIVCVGGLSFPKSGSTGDGYKMARDVGHLVTDTFPSLVPLRVPGTADLSGVALRDVEGSVRVDGKSAGPAFRGDVLFTHFGLSGPVVLQLSRAAADGLRRGAAVEIRLDLWPGVLAADLDDDWLERLAKAPKAQISTLLQADMPRSAIGAFLGAAGVPGERVSSELSRGDRLRIVETLRAWRFPVAGWHSMEAAEVTAGGVDIRQVDPRTFSSRLLRGLYWAGEVLDVDGYVGGYNLQAAWSSGWVAGRAAAAYAREET